MPRRLKRSVSVYRSRYSSRQSTTVKRLKHLTRFVISSIVLLLQSAIKKQLGVLFSPTVLLLLATVQELLSILLHRYKL